MGLHEFSRDFIGRCLSDQAAYRVLCDLVEQVGPRPSASPAERKATEIVLESLRSRGFETGIEEFSYPGWQPGPTTVTMHEAGRPAFDHVHDITPRRWRSRGIFVKVRDDLPGFRV